MGKGKGTAKDPWVLQTPSGGSEFQMYRAPDADPPALVCTVGKTELRYHLRAIDDLHAMLKKHGDWMELGTPTSRSRRRMERSKPGLAHRGTRSAAGTA